MEDFDVYSTYDHLAVELARRYSQELAQPFFVAIGCFSYYDIVSLDRKMRIELKCETTSIRTNNVCIEYWNPTKNTPSGVLITTANLWVHVVLESDGFHAYEYTVPGLRKLVIEQGGVMDNDKNSQFKLIPLGVFKKYARRKYPFDTIFADEIKRMTGITVSEVARPSSTPETPDQLDLEPSKGRI